MLETTWITKMQIKFRYRKFALLKTSEICFEKVARAASTKEDIAGKQGVEHKDHDKKCDDEDDEGEEEGIWSRAWAGQQCRRLACILRSRGGSGGGVEDGYRLKVLVNE